MTLAVVFKGPEGLVLAADSRVTLTITEQQIPLPGQQAPPPTSVQATYDNAIKLLKFKGHDYVAAVTYGLGAIGQDQPRTAHSLLPELETALATEARMSVETFAIRLRDFYWQQYQAQMPAGSTEPMYFFVAGYNQDEPYGRTYKVAIPGQAAPIEQQPAGFGIAWGGQTQITTRLLNGVDPRIERHVKGQLTIDDQQWNNALGEAKHLHSIRIPYQFLPLQDCVDLSILLVRTTEQLMRYTADARGVGGAVDVATITRNEGFHYVQSKQIKGES